MEIPLFMYAVLEYHYSGMQCGNTDIQECSVGISLSGMHGNTVLRYVVWEYRYSVCRVVKPLFSLQGGNTVIQVFRMRIALFRYEVWEYRFQVYSV